SVFAQGTDHSKWNKVLTKYVSTDGRVNYEALHKNPDVLIAYLNELVSEQPKNEWSKDQKLAYWINAYNAYTLKLIIDNYPIESIKDVKNPWDQEFIPFEGTLISLNTIEHNILRKMDEPRIHFAIVCASVSCPKLQNKAFRASILEEQLNNVTKTFLSDASKNELSKDKIKISKIFKWFKKDFEQNGSVIDFINKYVDYEILKDADIDYLNYNWSLND
ncbi:MAG: DUF547 domain-containing protein, partial [Bacteroidia bacterium]|nr:DUF547 domain-containing protein [Bacteroidia bacterium]